MPPIVSVTSETVTVKNFQDKSVTVFVRLTPKTRRFTQATQRSLLSTGLMIHIDPWGTPTPDLITSVIRYLEARVLAAIEKEAA